MIKKNPKMFSAEIFKKDMDRLKLFVKKNSKLVSGNFSEVYTNEIV
jgi:hypothetical protein